MAKYNEVNPKDIEVSIDGETIPVTRLGFSLDNGITVESILGGQVKRKGAIIDRSLSLDIPWTEEKFIQTLNFIPNEDSGEYEIAIKYVKTGNRITFSGCETTRYDGNLDSGPSNVSLAVIYTDEKYS